MAALRRGDPDFAQAGLFDLFARDGGAVFARIGIGGGKDFDLFFFGLFGFFVAFVFLFGHEGYPSG